MTDIDVRYQDPPVSLLHLVEHFWMLTNHSEKEHPMMNLPDGRIDVLFYTSAGQPYRATLLGLKSEPSRNTVPPKAVIFGVHFKLLAAAYILKTADASLLNTGSELPIDFGGITAGQTHFKL